MQYTGNQDNSLILSKSRQVWDCPVCSSQQDLSLSSLLSVASVPSTQSQEPRRKWRDSVLCIFGLWQKSPRNPMPQPGRHSTQNLPESILGSVCGTAQECHADVGHGEHCSTLCLSLLLKGPPKRDRSPQTMATQSLLADGPGLLLRVSGPIYYFRECFPFKTGLCSLYLLVETVQF